MKIKNSCSTPIFFVALFFLVACSNMNKTDIGLDNNYLKVHYNPQKQDLKVSFKSNEKVFLKNLVAEGATESFKYEETKDSIFGKGNALIINTEDGGNITFALYPSEPFLFMTRSVKNNNTELLDLEKLVPMTFNVDLGKPANTIKTLGTGGLLNPDENPGSYMFLTTVDPKTRNGVVTGWLTNEKGSGVVFSDIENDTIQIKTQIDYGHFQIPSGKTKATETLLIGYFDDARVGQEQFADALAKYNKVVLRERLAVYCTWYDEKHGGAGSEASSIALAKYIENNLASYGLGVLQIDDQWQDGGNYNGPARAFDRARKVPLKTDAINGTATNGFPAGYPNGMEKTAQEIKNDGLTAGIWWMPFARNHEDPDYADRQHWFAYRTNGKPYETVWGGTSLDLTNPEVQEHVSSLAKKMHGWGYDYFKMDGLWTGTVTEQIYINDGYINDSIGNIKPLHDPYMTQIEAFRNGLKSIRKVTNNEVFLSGCAISQNMRSFGASIGLVDAMRVGPDLNHDGQGIRTGAIRASRLYFLNGRVWWNDPDPSMLRESGESTADPASNGVGNLARARVLPSFVAISGQFYLTSDWLPDLPKERLDILKKSMASHSGTARPVDIFTKDLPSIWLATDSKSGTDRNVIGLFNWETKPATITSKLDWAGLNGNDSYHAFDFWSNKPLSDFSESFSMELPAESSMSIALRAKSGHPVVVSTSQHITQGMIDLQREDWNDNTLSGTSTVIGGDNYELRIAGLNDGANWNVDKVEILNNSNNSTIEVLPETEKSWLRVRIKSTKDEKINWQLKFNRL